MSRGIIVQRAKNGLIPAIKRVGPMAGMNRRKSNEEKRPGQRTLRDWAFESDHKQHGEQPHQDAKASVNGMAHLPDCWTISSPSWSREK